MKDREISVVAAQLRKLKSTLFRIAEHRERIPQPLFWSLFHSQLHEIKEEKARVRLLRSIFE